MKGTEEWEMNWKVLTISVYCYRRKVFVAISIGSMNKKVL